MTNTSNPISVRIYQDVLFDSMEELNIFIENHTMVRTVHIESDNGTITELDTEEFGIEEVIELDEDCE